jgi:hypothetical protein
MKVFYKLKLRKNNSKKQAAQHHNLQKIVTGMYAQKMALKKLFAWIYKKSKI